VIEVSKRFAGALFISFFGIELREKAAITAAFFVVGKD